VLQSFGPLLRGSIVLAFHGEPKEGKEIVLLLRPRLGFDEKNITNYQPPDGELQSVALTLKPSHRLPESRSQ
jgi:hypothetical protein